MSQSVAYLGDLPLNEEDARYHALAWIRSNLGQNPYVQEVRREGATWLVTIAAQFPKVLFDAKTGKPHRPLYYHFDRLGDMRINVSNAEIVDKPGFWEVHGRIKNELETIHTSVEKALTKVGAEPLSRLPFGEHMHTPMMNILSWLLVHQKLTFQEDERVEVEGQPVKMREYLSKLEQVQLVRITGNTAIPGNAAVEIFAQERPMHEKVRSALAVFFANGYDDIDSVRQVLGPHLALSRIIYEDSVEVGDIAPVTYSTVKRKMLELYSGYSARQKEFAIPRYLVQLSDVGLIESSGEGEDAYFVPVKKWFHAVLSQESLLEPVRAHVTA